MKIIDLDEAHKELFCLCLEDWSEEAKESGPRRRQWLERAQQQGLPAKLALDDAGVVGWMIQYGPIEHSFVEGAGLHFVSRSAISSSDIAPGSGEDTEITPLARPSSMSGAEAIERKAS